MIEELKRHLQSVGKTDSWLNLAVQFNILPNASNKQRSDKVRKVASNINWNKNVLLNTPLEQQPYSIFTSRQQREWGEFRKWKESKNIQPVKKVNGIHIVLPDIHIPYHNKELNLLLSFRIINIRLWDSIYSEIIWT